MARGATTVGELKAQLADLPDSYVIVVTSDEMDCDDAIIDLEIIEGTTSDGPGSVAMSISEP